MRYFAFVCYDARFIAVRTKAQFMLMLEIIFFRPAHLLFCDSHWVLRKAVEEWIFCFTAFIAVR